MKLINKFLMFCPVALFSLLCWYVIDVGYLVHEDATANTKSPKATDFIESDAVIRRGEYLTRVGNCIGCHTSKGGALYAGGRLIQSQFGNFISPNITPDIKTGIGNWSADNFWQALHFGKAPDGRLLYPAFPFTNYTLVSREDSDAMFAYLRSIPAVSQASLPHQLRFPFNQRSLLAVWRALYFRPQTYKPVATQSVEWNRGAYLVNGLGHCSVCHSSRNILGANAGSDDLGGGELPVLAWYAPSLLRMDEAHLSVLSETESLKLFKTSVVNNAAFSGPMAEVFATSIQYFSDADLADTTQYLRSLPVMKDDAPDWLDQLLTTSSSSAISSSVRPEVLVNMMQQGADLYKMHCADCHGASGDGLGSIYPALKQNNFLQMKNVANPIRIVLSGGFPPVSKNNLRPYGMPPFGTVLTDSEVAVVLTYIRNSWGNHASAVSASEVNRYRNAPVN